MEEDSINAVRSELETEEHEDGHLCSFKHTDSSMAVRETPSGDS